MKNYDELIKDGYTMAQINQIEKINLYSDLYDMEFSLKYINPDTDVKLIRKFIDALKNKKINDLETNLYVLNILKNNKDFEPILCDIDLEKKKIIARAICATNYSFLDNFIETIKQDYIKDDDYKILICDIRDDIDSSLYMLPGIKERQKLVARDALMQKKQDVFDIVMKMNPDYFMYDDTSACSTISVVSDALFYNMDIVELSYKMPHDFVNIAVIDNIDNLDEILKGEYNNNVLEIINGMCRLGKTKTEITDFFEKYPNALKRDSHELLTLLMLNSKEHYNIDVFLEKDVELQKVVKIIKFFDKLDEELQNKLIDKKFQDYELSLMKNCGNKDRLDLLPVLINCNEPDENAYFYIAKILKEDYIEKIFYDKGNDVFKTYDNSYEFNSKQKLVLSRMMYEKTITEEQLDMIRNNEIDAEVLAYLGCALYNNIDITPYLNDAKNMTPKEALSILENYHTNNDKNFETHVNEKDL